MGEIVVKIIKNLSKNINLEDMEFRYSYRIISTNFRAGQAYGIEVEREDYREGELVKIEREYIEKISCYEYKVAELLNILWNNTVSPIHLVDVVGAYVDEYVTDFSEAESMVSSF